MDSRLRGNDGERFAKMTGTHDCVVIDLSLSFPRRRESIGHHSDPHWSSLLESTESSMPVSIFSGASMYHFYGFLRFLTFLRDEDGAIPLIFL